MKKYNEIGHIYLISGSKLATTLDCLSQDLLHPSNKGHEMIALGISKVMKKYNFMLINTYISDIKYMRLQCNPKTPFV